jgi:hypothetical protein
MKVEDLIKDFSGERKPIVAVAAYLGLHPQTIATWQKKDGDVPEQWEALYRQKREAEK